MTTRRDEYFTDHWSRHAITSGVGVMDLSSMSKEEVRLLVYKRLREANVVRPPFPIEHRIPNFEGAEQACKRITQLPEWRRARVVKINPDSPQRAIRYAALVEGKILLMPTPRIRNGFLLLDPSTIPGRSYKEASTIKGAFRYGKPLKTIDALTAWIERVDFIVEGSVAVNTRGDRLGKGHGYGDLEWGILGELGLVEDNTPVATTVHDLQVFNSRLPQDPHDVPVDYIATPTRLIKVNERRNKPSGIIWSILDKEKIEEIPILKELAEGVL